jgi:glycosyltransferase involved in cell wall biosynthesis
MRVCYFGTYREEYSRNRIMIEALRRAGIEVIECHVALWKSPKDISEVLAGKWKQPRFWVRVVKAYWQLIQRYSKIQEYDLMIVGYPGQFDVALAKFLCRLKKRKVVWDVLMSIYQVAVERQNGSKKFPIINLIKAVERSACRQADRLIVDSRTYQEFLQQLYPIPDQKFMIVPLGADDRRFHPQKSGRTAGDGKFHVLFYGSFVPNHGIDIILRSARLFSTNKGIVFDLVGDGPEKENAALFIRENHLLTVKLWGFLRQPEFGKILERADICLGSFGATTHSAVSINNKVYECLASEKPLITGDSKAIRSSFKHREQLYICDRNEEALAAAIRDLTANPELRRTIARKGYRYYQENFSIDRISRQLAGSLEKYLMAEETLKSAGVEPK